MNSYKTIDSSSAEVDLILQCASSKAADKNRELILLLLESKIDWTYLLEMCVRHKILALVHFNLDKIASEAVPKDVRGAFARFYQANVRKNLLLTAELLKILDLYHNHEIAAVPLKGAILAKQAYGNFGLRTTSDIDIVVREADFIPAQQLLVQSGYKAHSSNNPQRVRQAQYNKPGTLLGVDLHYAFSPRNHFISVDSTPFWNNLTTSSLADREISVFNPEYMTIYLCLEGAKEHWRTLNRICDLSELICSQNINWKELLNAAKAIERQTTVYLGLYLAHTLLGTPIPNYVWNEVDSSLRIKLSKKEICNFLFRPELDVSLAFQWHSFNLQGFKSIPNRIRYLRKVIDVNFRTRFPISSSK